MINRYSRSLLIAAAALVASGAWAGQIQNRKGNQQQRIGNGVKSGQLTAGETAHLEGKEAGLNHEEHAMRAADGGKLTAGDRRVINRQQNRLSRNIYRDKHNDRTQPGVPPAGPQ